MSRPTWLVTARHRHRIVDGGDIIWRPYAAHHTRQVGSPFTLCGEVALDWPIFWDMPFDPEAEKACQGCARALPRNNETPVP